MNPGRTWLICREEKNKKGIDINHVTRGARGKGLTLRATRFQPEPIWTNTHKNHEKIPFFRVQLALSTQTSHGARGDGAL